MSQDHDTTVRASRRTAIKGTLAGLAGLGLAGLLRAGADARTRDPFARFSREWGELWRELLAEETPDEDRYVHRLCAALRSLPVDAVPRMRRAGFERDGVKSGGAWGENGLLVVELQLAGGAVIPAHNHVGYDFVSLVLEGDCVTRHYEPLDEVAPVDPGPSANFRVIESRAARLTPGRVSHLTRTRDNVHWFRAGEHGATLIDFGSQFEASGVGYSVFSALEVDTEPVDADRRVFEARWIGNPFR